MAESTHIFWVLAKAWTHGFRRCRLSRHGSDEDSDRVPRARRRMSQGRPSRRRENHAGVQSRHREPVRRAPPVRSRSVARRQSAADHRDVARPAHHHHGRPRFSRKDPAARRHGQSRRTRRRSQARRDRKLPAVRRVATLTAMRSIGLALLAATGCNQIFGIDLTKPWDAHAPIDAPDWTTAITWQTLVAGTITNDPIDGLTVQVGSLDATFPLAPATVDATGHFKVPYSVGLAPYRVVFMAPDALPTEIQTDLQGFTYAFPIYGPHMRGAVPVNATFSGTATGASGYVNARLLTAGVWSVTDEAPDTAMNGAFSFMYQAQGVSLSGPLGVPSTADGDVEVVTFMSNTYGGTDVDSGFAVFGTDALGSAGSAPVQTPALTVIQWSNSKITDAGNRITNSLANLAGGTSSAARQWAGAIPTTMMPGFVQPLAASPSS